ncbi:molybdopterin dinucleotide binding domain-containing protein, partial [Acinetobacter baumannii]
FQPHTAYSGVKFLRNREGEPFCVLNPGDAARRTLADGQKVRLHNDRASVGLILRVGEEIAEGVILVPGQRPGSEAV